MVGAATLLSLERSVRNEHPTVRRQSCGRQNCRRPAGARAANRSRGRLSNARSAVGVRVVSGKFLMNERALEIRWVRAPHCTEAGCDHPSCVCALCAMPIGVPEDDPRRAGHDDEGCLCCDLCDGDCPIQLFRSESCEMAAFHKRCFESLLSPAVAEPRETLEGERGESGSNARS